MSTKQPTIKEILDFNFAEELDITALPKEEQENFNENLFGSLIERMIKKTTENFSEDEQDEVNEMINNNIEIDNIFEFIAKKNENFIEEIGDEYLDFKAEIYELLN